MTVLDDELEFTNGEVLQAAAMVIYESQRDGVGNRIMAVNAMYSAIRAEASEAGVPPEVVALKMIWDTMEELAKRIDKHVGVQEKCRGVRPGHS